ncbi:MAG: hypothetical protein PVI00_16960, partial [Desulfobacterales bacterium]
AASTRQDLKKADSGCIKLMMRQGIGDVGAVTQSGGHFAVYIRTSSSLAVSRKFQAGCRTTEPTAR